MDMRQQAARYVGQPIVAHHVDGSIHRGILHSVTPDGMYIRYGAGQVSAAGVDTNFRHTDSQNHTDDLDAKPIFFGGLGFLPWFGLSGFWGGGFWW